MERKDLGMGKKLQLYGFNNLTKALSFNIYDVCYAKTAREQKDYIAYIDSQYNSERLKTILTNLTDMIGAKVLNIAMQDYEPQGSVGNHSDCRRFHDTGRRYDFSPSGQEPCNRPYLPGVSSGNQPGYLPGGY